MLQGFRSSTIDSIMESMITQEVCMMTLAQDLPMHAASGHVHTPTSKARKRRPCFGQFVLHFPDRGDIQRSHADLKGWQTIA